MEEVVELEALDESELIEETVPFMELTLASDACRLERVEMIEGTARPGWPTGAREVVGRVDATTRSSRTDSEIGSTREVRLSCAPSNEPPSSVGVDSGEWKKPVVLSLDFFLPRPPSIMREPARARFFLLAMNSTSSCGANSASESSGSS